MTSRVRRGRSCCCRTRGPRSALEGRRSRVHGRCVVGQGPGPLRSREGWSGGRGGLEEVLGQLRAEERHLGENVPAGGRPGPLVQLQSLLQGPVSLHLRDERRVRRLSPVSWVGGGVSPPA